MEEYVYILINSLDLDKYSGYETSLDTARGHYSNGETILKYIKGNEPVDAIYKTEEEYHELLASKEWEQYVPIDEVEEGENNI